MLQRLERGLNMDRADWQAIVDGDYHVPDGTTAGDLLPALLDLLGSPDPVLRDDFGYGITVRWIDQERLTASDLQLVIDPLLANLEHAIGSVGTDATLLRSFSVLVLAAIVYSDNHKQPFLAQNDYQKILNRTLAYVAAERDMRGYVPEIGWVHTVAHSADLLDELAISRWVSAADLGCMLDAIAEKLTSAGQPLLYNEDDRLSYAAMSMLKRGLVDDATVMAWADRIGSALNPSEGAWFDDPAHLAAYINHRAFLRSLVLRLGASDLPETVASHRQMFRALLGNL